MTLYKRVLTAGERSWMYNSGMGRTYSEVNPTATHTYGDASHKHAVTALTNGNTYTYDANGNQITRIIGTDTFNLKYDAENRLVEVKKNNVVVAAFTFDADGKRVKSVMGTETVLFVGAHYEVKNGSEITKYYLAGTTRVAMRKYTIPQPMTVEYLLSDHLNSTSLTTDASGAKVLELRYKAWGEVRATWTASPTTTPAYRSPAYTFTGQYSYMDDPTTSGVTEGFGLMFYGARFYDPAIGRFSSPDSMIPQEQGTQAWDRYAYVNNSPIRYNDPSGHVRVEDPGSQSGCSDSKYCEHGQPKPPKKDKPGTPHDASPTRPDEDHDCIISNPNCIYLTGDQVEGLANTYALVGLVEVSMAAGLLFAAGASLSLGPEALPLTIILAAAGLELGAEAWESAILYGDLNSRAQSLGTGGTTVERVQFGAEGYFATGLRFQGFEKPGEFFAIFGPVNKIVINTIYSALDK